MPNANSVRSSSSNNQNMEMNQGSVSRFAGGDGIYARELYNNINNQNMEINQGSIARELYNYFNNQNMEMNQGSFRQVTGGDRIYGRDLHNRIRNSNQHTETNDEIDDRINRLVNNSINRMRGERVVRMDNTPSICVISNPPYPNNSESSRRE